MTRRVVWILGAGFSMPLGGPSLASLLSWETERFLIEAIPDDPQNEAARQNLVGKVAQCTRWLYQYGTRFAANGGKGINNESGETLWSDAEDYFDKLDRAALDPAGPAARRYVGAVARSPHGATISIVDMRDTAKRLLAFECSRFLDGHDAGQEPWLPYMRWKRMLVGEAENPATSQVIITFNYDCVLESLGLQGSVVLPGQERRRRGPQVLKLHGSTNWRRQPGETSGTPGGMTIEVQNDTVELATEPNFPATCKSRELAIAAPGPGKQEEAERFQELWKLGGGALKAAGAVVFLGYRIPPTDARSRRFLLENLPRGQYPIHIVLGHDTNSPDARRIQGLLTMARPEANINALPMFAQDYLDAWEPNAW